MSCPDCIFAQDIAAMSKVSGPARSWWIEKSWKHLNHLELSSTVKASVTRSELDKSTSHLITFDSCLRSMKLLLLLLGGLGVLPLITECATSRFKRWSASPSDPFYQMFVMDGFSKLQ